MPPSRKRISRATLFFALLSLVLGVLLYRASRNAPGPAPARVAPSVTPGAPRPAAPSTRSRSRAERPTPHSGAAQIPSRSASGASVAIVIDDLGNDRAAVERISRWPWSVAGAVLPALPSSGETARELERSGKEVLLHLPMEPKGFPGVRPGPGVVLVSQSDEEIAAIVIRDLESVPGAVGVSNHMGSVATADPRVMRAVVRVLAGQGLFFLDSRTTDATVALEAAREWRVKAASRRVFLDDVQREEAIEASLDGLIAKAKADGSAIGIGHPYPSTLAVLDRELPGLARRGVRLVRVRELVE